MPKNTCSIVRLLERYHVTSDTVIFGRKTSLLNNIVRIVVFVGVTERILFLLLRFHT